MRNVYEVLQEKESAVRRVAHEIEMLRLVAPLLSDDDTQSHDVINHDAPRQDEHWIAYNRPPNKNKDESTDYSLYRDAHEDEVNTGIVSAPSLLANDPNDEDSDGQDEADSVPGTKISGRLKKLVRPLVSFVAG